jgi:hypothetical protein
MLIAANLVPRFIQKIGEKVGRKQNEIHFAIINSDKVFCCVWLSKFKKILVKTIDVVV